MEKEVLAGEASEQTAQVRADELEQRLALRGEELKLKVETLAASRAEVDALRAELDEKDLEIARLTESVASMSVLAQAFTVRATAEKTIRDETKKLAAGRS